MLKDIQIKKSSYITIAGFLLLVYLIFIIFISNVGQDKLLKSQKNEFDLKFTNQVSTLSYFFSICKEDIQRLSEDRAFETYFSNKALGMSLKYGLKANLIKITESLNKFNSTEKINNIQIFSDVALLDNENHLISKDFPQINTQILEQLLSEYKSPQIIFSISQDKLDAYAVKSLFSNEIKIGTLIAKINLEKSLKNLLIISDKDTPLYIVYKYNSFNIPNLKSIEENHYNLSNFLIRSIENTDISLVADNSHFNNNDIYTSKKFIIILTILTIFVFIGIIYLIRLNANNIFLHSQMSLTKKINEVLERKVEEKTKELKSLNNHLQTRVEEEVNKNQENQRILYHQSKMAAMGEMLNNIAHQWRQPLSSISSLASGIKVQKEVGILSNDELSKSMDDIVESVNFLSNTINDFRDFFKSNRDKKLFSIKDAYDKTFKMLYSRFKNSNIEVIKNIDEIKMNGYENELIQVLLNILNNAHDALVIHNIPKKIIFIDVFKEYDHVVIKIKDNADGIPQDIIKKVFNPYFTTKANSDGTGIGLYMTQEIIKNHMKGDIIVSNVNYEYDDMKFKGAEFIIKIPENN